MTENCNKWMITGCKKCGKFKECQAVLNATLCYNLSKK